MFPFLLRGPATFFFTSRKWLNRGFLRVDKTVNLNLDDLIRFQASSLAIMGFITCIFIQLQYFTDLGTGSFVEKLPEFSRNSDPSGVKLSVIIPLAWEFVSSKFTSLRLKNHLARFLRIDCCQNKARVEKAWLDGGGGANIYQVSLFKARKRMCLSNTF